MLHVACLLGFSVLVGCESPEPVGQVTGKVTYKSEPVGEGVVHFSNSEVGFSADAKIGSDGFYTLTTHKGGVPPAEYKVTISPPEIPDPSSGGDTAPGTITKEMDNIPEKYRSLATTPLTATVKEGKNQVALDMED